MSTRLRVSLMLLLLAVTAFCVFGFLARYELQTRAERLPWQIGYSALGVACVGGSIALVCRCVGSGRKR
jgi:hypothetical protein